MFNRSFLRHGVASGVSLRSTFMLSRSVTNAVSFREPIMFTPGPLITSASVKQAMLVDLGSRDPRFLNILQRVMNSLVTAANGTTDTHAAVLVQGAGSNGIEAVLSSAVPENGHLLILSNGAYGQRQELMCRYMNIPCTMVEVPDDQAVSVSLLKNAIAEMPTRQLTHVSMIHHETTAGVLNPLQEIGEYLATEHPHIELIVDAMSSFGAYPVNVSSWNISYLVSSANKCFEGVPGFSYAIANKKALEKTDGIARSYCFDLLSQWKNLTATGQFRFTPPTHVILAFDQAMSEWESEGGAQGRLARYQENYDILYTNMVAMGFELYVKDPAIRGCIITTFIQPEHENWNFDRFYNYLSDYGVVIYPGKLASGESFRLGSIGRISASDCKYLCLIIKEAMADMDIHLPLQ